MSEQSNTSRIFAFGSALTLFFLTSSLALATNKPAPKPTNDECLACHSDATLTHDVNGKPVSLSVDPQKFKDSIHGSMFTCVDCHTDVKTAPHEQTPAKITCGTCHADEQSAYDRSFHAKARLAGNLSAATCTDCHGSPHELLPGSDPKSRVSHANIPGTCGACHEQKFVMGEQGAQMVASYQQSVHGHAVAAGSDKAAVCTDCHGTHEILDAKDAKSPIFKFNVPNTCGKCHQQIAGDFLQSIHGQAITQGNWQAPVCTDCHGIHSIKSHLDPNSPVAAQNVAQATCARCHDGVRLSQEFGVPGRRETTYLASYHGLASQLGSQVVANCASCHGVHNILPSSDPRSTINKANLPKTCGQCHPGVTEEFVLAKVHVDAPLSADVGSKAVRWIRRFYLGMIVAVIGGMLLHNFILWRFKVVERRKRDRSHFMVTRMESRFRWQHAALLGSFFVLVITGFALKFPESWYASMLGLSETIRGTLHRIAAVVLISVSIYHLFDVALTRKGRKLVLDLLPTPDDIRGVRDNLLYHLGFISDRPTFARFNYAEKAEYWALVWGMFVMAGTGLMLWAKVFVGNHLPRWFLDIATAIHYYEAILATLAILVWHFYQVFLDPDVYPMNWAWWDGKMPAHHYREEHGLDSETLKQAAAEEHAHEEEVETAGAKHE